MAAADWPGQFVAIARIVKPQGRRGEVAAEILTDFPERFEALKQAFLENPGAAPDPVAVEECWAHKGRIVLKLSGIDSIDAADRLRSRHVLIPREERREPGPQQHYLSDLIGCAVVILRAGTEVAVGEVVDVQATGGTDLVHVKRPDGQEVLIPLAEAICLQIDTDAKRILIDPPEGLLELNS